MSALRGALEGRSKPETDIERNPERGYRLLVKARAAVAEDLPKYNPPTRQVPDDPFQVDVEAADYILEYHGELMTKLEHRASAHWSQTMMTDEDWETMEPDYREPMTEQSSPLLSTDPAVLKLLEDGYDGFAVRTASRILEEHGDRLSLSRCPR